MLGYPIDNRSEGQRAKAASNILGDVERNAARVVARLTGETVTLQDDNSYARMPDIRIDHEDGRVGYIEVVTDFDTSYAEMASILRKKGSGIPHEVVAPELHRVWFLGLTGRANHAKLDRALPALLGRLEEACVTPTIVTGDHELADSDNADLRKLHELGIADISSRETRNTTTGREAGRVLMFAAGASGPAQIDWDAFTGWINTLLASESLRTKRDKLVRTQASERHLFLGISYTTSWAGFLPLTANQTLLPDTVPNLPAEITHLWIMNIQAPGRCLVWYPDLGWRDAQRHWKTD